MNIKCLSIKFYGKVQNVGFRYFVYRLAAELGVKGFVKNLPDGSVYAEVEADENTIDVFVNHCNLGPSHAYVSNIQVNEIPSQNFTNFTIK
jgi:acylphosphatase